MTQKLLKELINYHCAGGWGKDKEFDESELVNVIRGTDFGNILKGNIQSVPCRFEKKSKVKKCLIQEDDILIEISGGSAAKGQSVGRTLLVTKEILDLFDKNVIPASFCRLIRLDKNIISAPYIYYNIQNLYKNKQITIWEKQSTGISNFQFTDFINELFIDVLDFDEYRNRIFPLEILDKKIELNQKMNIALEDIAKTLFKSWFIDFDPVRAKAEGRPTGLSKEISDLFPDSFEESELGEIPKCWNLLTFGDFVTPIRGKVITKKTTNPGDIPVVAGGLEPAYFHSTANVQGPAVTISASGANAGYTNLYFEDIWASDCSYISNKQSSNVLTSYIFLKLNQERIFDSQHGAAQPHIYPDDLRRLDMVIPSNDLYATFENLITSFFNKIKLNIEETKNLISLRDALLPKLISGELKTPDAENLIKEAGI